jgi:hypothetical protein
MKHQPSPRTLTVMSGREEDRSGQAPPAQHGDEPVIRRRLGEAIGSSARGRLLRVGAHAAPGADGSSLAVSGVPTPNVVRKWRLRRLGDWLAAVMADDGVGARFAAERRRDEELVRRVERRRRP